MDAISYERAADIAGAVRAAQQPGTVFIGGGTNLLDLMKGGVERPVRLVDITHISGLDDITPLPGGGIRIGALVRNSDAANHPLVREQYPLLSQAFLSGASAQLRNMATVGGNLLQRTRCAYFYDTAFSQCNKRLPGSGCAALEGNNRMHAILGASSQCVAVNPSDMSVALAALDAAVRVSGPAGERSIPFAEFHRLPGDRPDLDTTLRPGELITSVDLPPPLFSAHSHYLKVRDRASYAFALVSVAAALHMDGERVQAARIALGGVAHKPWRASAAEQMLNGQPFTQATLTRAAAAALSDARPLAGNRFKVQLAQRAMVRAVNEAAGRQGGAA
ncbi:xanthine dehydrogenase family protein subunit M [bacterium M00.F.Ca.ET.228.01.1.1]|uniref:FAD binding domain-containing protein n=1 Tax=Paraburkholderia phenoliruptrix TaxID=252970 RepID=UPI0010931254|nr:xanthine dehydrogenase family protein subunit M [Paraburkholderia phenoliruptrix]TGP40127.1 xanthine dehydrogenase family protein subunit M [bacterium M00.F.Ca.ET.228.01.1.1]TGR96102.1 xanthine dehydrogenase family protein subunit M [bacterium M00.F.Ca.ET.191.01.1.1]TGT97239.1 xanthine dehydrogenase family protein subunit M [bacterium M00.F.Ca.ET.155.01.1.1]MBW0450719.1 xanthine dehydrogenase family protein subunit M [Paraburkholderia phenoliruptrix]MBW9101800.1 xanthine dehydrogenase famil